MRIKQVGNKADTAFIVIRNAETTQWIRRGMIVCFSAAGSGVDVYLPKTITVAVNAAAQQAGIATTDIAPQQFGEALVSGFCNYIAFPGSTRGSATVPFPPFAGGTALNCPGVPDVANNGMAVIAAPATAQFVGGIWLVGSTPAWPQIPVNPGYTELQSYVPVSGYVKMM